MKGKRVAFLVCMVMAVITILTMPVMVQAEEEEVEILLTPPEGWVSSEGRVQVSVKLREGSTVEIKSVEAKEGDGRWVDITTSMVFYATQNGTVTVRVKDAEGGIYEKSITLDCIDKGQPTLIAAISDGVLHIQAQDDASGIKDIYVNGYGFTNVPDGDLSIRLQQFDASYAEFKIQVVDAAGNVSDIYIVENPYLSDDRDEDFVHYLPVSAIPDEAEHSSGTVTQYSTPEITLSGNELFQQQRELEEMYLAMNDGQAGLGKEIYTIETTAGRTFYLVIDKDQSEDNAYLLTMAGENDLLNFINDDDEVVLPQNAAVITEHTLTVADKSGTAQMSADASINEGAEEAPKEKKDNSILVIGVIAAGAIGIGAYVKLGKGKKKKSGGEYDEDLEEAEEFEDEQEEIDGRDA